MGNQFDWQFEEGDDELPALRTRRRWVRGIVGFWIIAAILTISLVGAWITARDKDEENTQDLVQATQDILDIQQQAVADNDGEIFFSLQDDDSDWFVAQLLPENQAINRIGLEITNAEQRGEAIWANAIWRDEDESFQQVLFFEWRAGQLRQIHTDPYYWGAMLQNKAEWGTLAYYAVDDPWAATITNYVDGLVKEVCASGCLEDRYPLTIEIGDDYTETAEPNRIRIPSPRLLGLDSTGEPSNRFWQQLSRRINNYLTPATIRFAVPPPKESRSQAIIPYEQAAQQFMAEHPEITIEIVQLDSVPDDLSILAVEFDGAAIPPTEQMLAAGLVHDLTSYIDSDPEFDQADFYEQIWQGSSWRGRTWFMPQAAEMRVLYFDKVAYRRAGRAEPSSRWTWDEMAEDVSSLVAGQPQQSDLAWGFLDVGLDSLFSYAYNWNNQCTKSATILCQTPLRKENVVAALEWYGRMAAQPGQMPNLTTQMPELFVSTQKVTAETLDDDDRLSLLWNFQGARRKSAIWVDLPVNYEFNLLLASQGVVPFPGSDRFDGIAPLWLQGSFISSKSEQSLAVWQWLKFLSYQSPAARLIPARPSVAAQSGFWTTIPQPLGNVMRTAFPFARPVTMEDQAILTWAQVTAVISGASSPQEAAQERTKLQWFASERE